jgi:cell division protein FtsB
MGFIADIRNRKAENEALKAENDNLTAENDDLKKQIGIISVKLQLAEEMVLSLMKEAKARDARDQARRQ